MGYRNPAEGRSVWFGYDTIFEAPALTLVTMKILYRTGTSPSENKRLGHAL